MKNVMFIFILGIAVLSCNPKPSQESIDLNIANSKVKSNVELYSKVWDTAINGRNIEIINLDNFDKDIKAITQNLGLNFKRIQFTPDLLPSDVIGTMIYNQKKSSFEVKKGPVFSNIILADEINRSPAKVQSALLESMQEKQVTIGDDSYKLDLPFLVLATQNPIDQEGTYPLPEAQRDRFMMKLNVDYPSKEEELKINYPEK